jgi:hypothetical protein
LGKHFFRIRKQQKKEDLMKTLKQFFKTLSLRQLVVVFLAGVFMLVSTACSSGTRAAAPAGEGYNPDTPGQAMYPHKDTKRDTTAADAKADRLIRQAEKRRQKIQGPGDYVEEVEPGKTVQRQAEKVGQSAKQAAENIGKSTQRAAESAAESTQKGLRNVQEGASKAADQAAGAVDRATTPNFPNS